MRRPSWRYLAPASILLGAVLVAVSIWTTRPPAPARLQVVPPATIIEDPVFPSPPAAAIADGTRIVVPDLGIDLPVVPGDGENAPLFKAATFPSLKLPGQGGRSLIYAHARAGMFGPLFRAHTGERIEIHEPGGKVLAYTIREYYPRWSSLDLKWLQPANHEELILVTCTTYNVNDPRIIAVAEPA